MITIEKSTEEEQKQVEQGLDVFTDARVAFRMKPQLLNFCAKSSDGKLMGGIQASIGYWGGTDVHVLWVDEQHRGKGIGKQLMQKVEQEAKALGGTIIRTDCFEFHAKGFYLGLGYEVFGELKGFPNPENTRYYLKKLI